VTFKFAAIASDTEISFPCRPIVSEVKPKSSVATYPPLATQVVFESFSPPFADRLFNKKIGTLPEQQDERLLTVPKRPIDHLVHSFSLFLATN